MDQPDLMDLSLEEFRPEHAAELVAMWRESFEHGVGVTDPHPLEEQRQYLVNVLAPGHAMRVALLGGRIVGFVAASRGSIAQLYVKKGFHHRGIGSRLLAWAREQSGGSLWLYTFERNTIARAFYEKHGFRIVARGFEPEWKLADVRYEWAAATGRAAIVETSRLRLRHFAVTDLAAFVAYRNDPEVARYQSWEFIDPANAARIIDEQAAAQPGRPGKWFQFAVTLRTGHALIGDCGLCIDPSDPRLAEIGFTFDASHQGRSLASEAVVAVLGYSFDTLGLHRVKAIIDRRNDRALRLAKRVGMREEALFLQHAWFKGSWCDEYQFAMLASDWAGRAIPGSR